MEARWTTSVATLRLGVLSAGHTDPSLLRRVGRLTAFAVVPALLIAYFLFAGGAARGFDLQQHWEGGRAILHGSSPYSAVDGLPGTAAARELDPTGIREIFRFPYPAPAALAMVPFALLPLAVAKALFLALLVACIPAALLLVGVRDWRCYGAAFLWLPVLTSIRLGTLTPLLVLAAALAWRFRDDMRRSASAVAAGSAAKIFVWPLAVWLAATRRVGTAVAAMMLGAAVVIAAWAVIGFAGLSTYPEFLRHLSAAVEDKGYSPTALVLALGGSATAGHLLGFALAAALLAAAGVAGRRPDGDAAAFVLACAAALVVSPIVWLHYFALLLIPVAVASPQLGPLWFLPLAFWATPDRWGDQSTVQIGVALLVVLGTAAAATTTIGRTSIATPRRRRVGGRSARAERPAVPAAGAELS